MGKKAPPVGPMEQPQPAVVLTLFPGITISMRSKNTIEFDLTHHNDRLAIDLGGVIENNDQDNYRAFPSSA